MPIRDKFYWTIHVIDYDDVDDVNDGKVISIF